MIFDLLNMKGMQHAKLSKQYYRKIYIYSIRNLFTRMKNTVNAKRCATNQSSDILEVGSVLRLRGIFECFFLCLFFRFWHFTTFFSFPDSSYWLHYGLSLEIYAFAQNWIGLTEMMATIALEIANINIYIQYEFRKSEWFSVANCRKMQFSKNWRQIMNFKWMKSIWNCITESTTAKEIIQSQSNGLDGSV